VRAAPPPPGEVHVWFVDLDAVPGTPDTLSDAERARAGRYRSAPDRRRFVARRLVLRGLLGGATGLDAGSVAFGSGPYGKPRVAHTGGPDVRFSLSHRGPHAVVAMATGCEVGVDVEAIRPWGDVGPLVARVCSPAEARALYASADPAALFAQLWAAKEALLKASGVGLSSPPAAVDVLDGGALAAAWADAAGAVWPLARLDAPAGFRAAVAAAGPLRVVRDVYPGVVGVSGRV
jgi:4'-phosphopantetheinyl transferase